MFEASQSSNCKHLFKVAHRIYPLGHEKSVGQSDFDKLQVPSLHK